MGYTLQNWDYSYVIEDVKGHGGFGITYSAYRVEDDKHVAIKEYFPRQLNMQRLPDGSVAPNHPNDKIYQGGMESFLDEAKALAKLRNIPSVVEALSYFQTNGTAYLVMEFVDGISLKNLIMSKGTLKADTFLPMFKVLLEDIEKMHRTGLLHRDIAPDNIMLTKDNILKLIDFGSARSIENGKSMTVLLKPGFAPIEQYQSHGQGTYTDVYGVCATLYYCLTGKVPPAAMNRLDDDPIVPPNEYGAGLTKKQQQVLLRGLAVQPPTAKTPGRYPRYRTMGEFIKAFPWKETPGWDLPKKQIPPVQVEPTIDLDDRNGQIPAAGIAQQAEIPSVNPQPSGFGNSDYKESAGSSPNRLLMIVLAIIFGLALIVGFCAMCDGSGGGAILMLIGAAGLAAVVIKAYNNSRWKG